MTNHETDNKRKNKAKAFRKETMEKKNKLIEQTKHIFKRTGEVLYGLLVIIVALPLHLFILLAWTGFGICLALANLICGILDDFSDAKEDFDNGLEDVNDVNEEFCESYKKAYKLIFGKGSK